MKIDLHHFELKGAGKEKCDDFFYMVHGKGKSLFLLADGVSEGRFCLEGAYGVAVKLGTLIDVPVHETRWTEEEFGDVICGMIQNTLTELAHKRKCDKKEFASTLLLGFYPGNGEEVWLAHIGDGILLHVEEGGSVRILSYPHYGILKQYTYTTASPDLHRLIRVSQNKISGWVVGMTDGMTNEIMEGADTLKPEYDIMFKKKDWNGLERKMREKSLADDASFFVVRVKGEGGSKNGC